MSLYDIVRPAEGWQFDAMVVCTYSADLRSVLALPGALAGNETGAPFATSVVTPAQLAVLRRTCDQTVIFCQEAALLGADELPPAVIETEAMVHEVTAPGGGAFHPKVWLVRFKAGKQISYRLAVMSRNLTADRSWDAGVIMEGKTTSKPRGRDGLCALLSALPDRCRTPLDPGRGGLLSELAKAAEQIVWAPPPGLSRLELRASGLGDVWAPPSNDRLIVFSPFLDQTALKQLARNSADRSLIVSRPDALDRCWSTANALFARQAVLAPPSELAEDVPNGALHAKVFAWDKSSRRGMAVGSMNATSAALSGRNVEFMAVFDATKLLPAGVSALVDEGGLGSALADYAPVSDDAGAESPPDDRSARRTIADLALRLVCECERDEWRIRLHTDRRLTAAQAGMLDGLTFRPATVPRASACPCLAGLFKDGEASFASPLSLAQVTGYIVFQAKDIGAFTLRLAVEGVTDEERRQAALRTLLPDERSFMDFVRALLGDANLLDQVTGAGEYGANATWGAAASSGGLLEMMIRCAADDADRLKHLDQAIRSFGNVEFERLAPESFRTVWQALAREAGIA